MEGFEKPFNFLREINNDFEPISFSSFVNAVTNCKNNYDLTEINQFYEDLKNKRSPRLIINKPLFYNYSYLITSIFPLYAIFDQDIDIITISCNEILSKTSNMIRHDLFHEFKLGRYFDISLLKNIYSTSLFGSLVGRGCKILILDDLSFGNELIDDNTITEWLINYAYTRLYPNFGIICLNSSNNRNNASENFIRSLKNKMEI